MSPLRGASLEGYAQTYLAGNTLTGSSEDSRPGAHGRFWRFDSPDGSVRHTLLLLAEDGAAEAARAYGLYAQGESALFEQQRPLLEDMARSLTLERPARYPELRDERCGCSLRVPPSWRETRRMGGGESLLVQFTSPALGADRGGQTVHASLSLSVERLAPGTTLDAFRASARERLGESWQLVAQVRRGRAWVDTLRAETPLSASRQKRFYHVARGRGYTLAFEARDDTFHRVARWCDLIADTFHADGESDTSSPEEAAR